MQHQYQAVGLSLVIRQDQAAYSMYPLRLFITGASHRHDDVGERFAGENAIHRIGTPRQLMIVAVPQLETHPVFVDVAAEIFKPLDAVHRQRRPVRPADALIGIDENYAFRQPGDDLLKLSPAGMREGNGFAHLWFQTSALWFLMAMAVSGSSELPGYGEVMHADLPGSAWACPALASRACQG